MMNFRKPSSGAAAARHSVGKCQAKDPQRVKPFHSNETLLLRTARFPPVPNVMTHLDQTHAERSGGLRHTFATTVTLTNGVPIETVSKMLGHKTLRTTQQYAKILDQKVGEE